MRVAVLNDIHGNLAALEAVIDEVRAASVDRIVAGGDVILGPMPREALELLTSCGIPVEYVLGNCEVAVLEAMAGKPPSAMPAAFQPLAAWNGEQIGAGWGDAIARWPKTLRLRVDGVGEVLFCHGTPRDENEIFTARTPDARLRAIVAGVAAPLVVCGHTHMPFDLTAGATRIVNAGSVGMPFGAPGADWLLLGPDVELRHTAYDLDRAAERVRATGYLQAQQFVGYILNPPSAEQMLAVYAKADAPDAS